MSLTAVVATIDAAAATYLITYGLRRERRDQTRVLIVGGMLIVCAVALACIGWPRSAAPHTTPAPSTQASPGTAV